MKKITMSIFLILLFLTSIQAVSAIPSLPHVSVSPTSGYAPLNVKFTATNTASLTSFTWDFGDGKISTIQDMSQVNTNHVYTQPGAYRTRVEFSYVYNGDHYHGGYSGTLITVYPTADFSVSPTAGKAPLTVKFKDTSTGSPTSWSWNFGDGISSYEQNPVHTYNRAGDYTVILSVRYASGNTEIKSRYIVVTASAQKPVAAFTASPLSGKKPLTVKFADKSKGLITSRSWNFGDNSTSTVKNPVHKYTEAGKYTVTLTVKNTAGSNTAKKTNYITVK